MKELASVWDDLSDITQANILEKIGGKRNANVTAAILQNFETAERVVETSANSAGSALAENEKYLDSINGRIAQFQASWQSLSATMISSDLFKGLVTGATGFINVLDTIASKIGAVPTLIGALTAGISGFRLFNGDRTGIFDVLTDKQNGNKWTGVSVFGKEWKAAKSDLKDMYNTFKEMGSSRIGAGFQTAGYSLFNMFTGAEGDIKQFEDVTTRYKRAQEEYTDALHERARAGADSPSEREMQADKNLQRATEAMDQYNHSIRQGTSLWSEYARAQMDAGKAAEISRKGFYQWVRDEGKIGQMIGSSLKNFGANALSLVGSAAMSMGVSALLNLAITGIGKLITAQDDLRKKTNEATTAHQQEMQSITDYGTEVQGIYDNLSSGTLSVDETIQARQRLMQIQGELQSSYGSEAAGLNQITVGAKEASAALDELAAKQAHQYLQENKLGLNRAQQEMTSDYSYRTSFKTTSHQADGTAVTNGYTTQALQDIASQLDNADIFTFLDRNGTVKLNITGNPDEVLDTISEIRDAASKAGIDLGDVTVSGGRSLDDQLSEWEKIERDRQAKYGSDWHERTQALIQENSEFLGIQNKINDAQNKYNEAVVGSYDNDTARAKAIADRISQIHELQGLIDSTEFTGKDGADVRQALQDQLDSLIDGVKTEELKADLELNLNTDSVSDSFKDIQSALDKFKGKDGEIKLSTILDAEGTESWNALEAAASNYGLTVESLLPILAQFNMIQSDSNALAFDAATRFGELKTSTEAIETQQSTLSTALKEQAANGTISLGTYNSLIATSKDFANTLEYESGAMKINGEMAQRLVEAKTKEQVAEMQLAKSQALERYKQNEEAIKRVTTASQVLTEEQQKQQEANLARWQSENESIMDVVNKYNILIAELQHATGAYAQWQTAKETDNSDAIYKNLVTAKKDIDAALKSGQTGRGNDDYTAAIKLLVPEGEDIKTYRDNVLNRYLKLDDDGNLKWEGLQNFLNDAVKQTDEAGNNMLMTLKDGLYEVADGATLQDFIDKMKITPEMAKAIFDALEMYDFEFDYSDEEFLDAQNMDLAKRRAAEYADELSKLQEEYEEIQNNKDLTPTAQTEQLEAKAKEIQEVFAKETVAKVQAEVSGLSEGEAALQAIQDKQQEINELKSKPNVDSSAVEQAKEELASLQEYINNLSDSEIELTVSNLKSNIESAVSALSTNKAGSDPWNEAKANLQNYLSLVDSLPDKVKTDYNIGGNYESKLKKILSSDLSDKEVTVSIKFATAVESGKEIINKAKESIQNFASSLGGKGGAQRETVNVDANTDSAKSKIKGLENEIVKVKIDGDVSLAQQKIASIQANTPVMVTVDANSTVAQSKINSLQANPVMVNIEANTAVAQLKIAALAAKIKGSKNTVTVNYKPNTKSLPTRFSALTRVVNYVANTKGLPTSFPSITRNVYYKTTVDKGGFSGTGGHFLNGTAHANGTANENGKALAGGNWGAKTGGMTLVGELGREIVVDPHSGQWYTVGDTGAEFQYIPKGAIVFNHEQTESLLSKGYVFGRASALVSGTAMVSGGGRGPTQNTTTTNKTKVNTGNNGRQTNTTNNKSTTNVTATADVTVDVRLNDKQLEEKLKDKLSEMSDNFEYILGQYEHQIFLKEQNKADYKEIVSLYQDMLKEIHDKANEYRALGLSDNSKTVMEMQKKWFEYRDAMRDAIKEHYEKEQGHLENLIQLTQHQYDDAATRNNYALMESRTNQIIAYNERLKEVAHEAADAMRSLGFDDASDEVMEWSDAWWSAADAIREAKQAIIDHLVDLVDKASDAIDDLQSAFESFQTAAEEFSKTGGFISIDTFQDLMTMGPQYMQLLRDENGLLVINRENVEKLMAARVRDLAAQAAVTYARRVAMAAEKGAIEDLNELLYATRTVTDATWALAYATISAANLTSDQYKTALFNINAMYSMMENTIAGIGVTMNDEFDELQNGMSDLIDYVMDMIKDRIEEQKEALNDLVDDYKDIVDLKKESLKLTKEENDYQKSLRNKLREMAKLQERINALSLDDSREAQAERAKLIADLADLQEETNELQADKAYDVQTDALDKQYDAYKKEKDDEIKILEESISSQEKLYRLAIQHIEAHWDTLYDELLEWNTEMGSSLNSEINDSWQKAIKLVEQYKGSVIDAINAAKNASDSISGGIAVNDVVGNTNYNSGHQGIDVIADMMNNSANWTREDPSGLKAANQTLASSLSRYGITTTYDKSGTWYVGGGTKYKLYDMYKKYLADGDIGWLTNPEQTYKQRDIISQMKANAAKWKTYDRTTEAGKKASDALNAKNIELGKELTNAGLAVKRGSDGVWYIVKTGEKLFEKYHQGGIVGTKANVKQDEVLAVLQKGEAVLDEQKQNGLYRIIDFAATLSDRLGVALKNFDTSIFSTVDRQSLIPQTAGVAPTIVNSPTITFGDTYITGADESTIKKHQEISRNMVNEILDTLHIRK